MAKRKNCELHVVRVKPLQHATIGKSGATDHATRMQHSNLKAAATRVLSRNSRRNHVATHGSHLATNGATHQDANIEEIPQFYRSELLAEFSSIGLFRSGDQLHSRKKPQAEQARLLQKHYVELVDALRPRLIYQR